MEIVRRGCCPCERPLLFVAPAATDKQASFGRFVCISSSHHIDPDGRFLRDAVVCAFQPVIEPSGAPRVNGECRIGGKLSISCEAATLSCMSPWSDRTPLTPLLRLL